MALRDTDSATMIAVRDMARAKHFYGGVLELEQLREINGVAIYRTGGTQIVVYVSEFAGTNRATTLAWTAGDTLNDIVDTLSAKGVTFEHYEFPGVTFDGRIHYEGDLAFAWFKDPDGNILEINNG